MNKQLTSIFVVLALFFFSCKQTKVVQREIDMLKKAENVLQNVQDSALNFSAITLKANVSISGGKQNASFKSSLRIKKDSAMWASITFLGIAGAKVLITDDTIEMVNYKDKVYIKEEFGMIVELFNSNLINLKNLQAILLGNLIDVEGYQKLYMDVVDNQYAISTLSDRKANKDWIEKKLQKMEKKLEKNEEKNTEKSQERIDRKFDRRPDKFQGLEIDISVDPTLNKVTVLEVKDHLLNGTLKAIYSDFRVTEAGIMPFNTKLEIRGGKNIDLDIVYSKVTFSDNVEMPFSVPKKYERNKL
jgi:hypothetical protein